MNNDDLLLDEDDLLPGELAFGRADLERKIRDLEETIKRRDEGNRQAVYKMKEGYERQLDESRRERLNIEKQLDNLKAITREGEIVFEDERVRQQFLHLDRERTRGVVAIRFLCHLISKGLIETTNLPVSTKVLIQAIKAWAEESPTTLLSGEIKLEGGGEDWLRKQLRVGDKVGEYEKLPQPILEGTDHSFAESIQAEYTKKATEQNMILSGSGVFSSE